MDENRPIVSVQNIPSSLTAVTTRIERASFRLHCLRDVQYSFVRRTAVHSTYYTDIAQRGVCLQLWLRNRQALGLGNGINEVYLTRKFKSGTTSLQQNTKCYNKTCNYSKIDENIRSINFYKCLSVWTSSKSTPPVRVADVRMMWKMRFSPVERKDDNKVTHTPIMELIRSPFVSLEEAAMQIQTFASDSRRPLN